MDHLLEKFEKYISYILIAIAMIYVCYQIIDLVIQFTNKLITDVQNHTMAVEEKGKPVIGIFFTILLTLEIIQTIRVFAHDHATKVRVILIVGLIAVTRKILLYDMGETDVKAELAIAALILALSAGYFLVSRAENKRS
jgi:uncharacterized membrane protein (DUF373 family)